ncbi:putative ABC transporter ATP-binding domain protein [Synechococcus sp. MEDNS5]|nr:putative ABC transporter ATP-binding domain protein [Synechococcus sp. MEDNS5]
MPTISARRPPGRDVLLPSEGHDAVAAAPSPHGDACLIDELHETPRWVQPPTLGSCSAGDWAWQAFASKRSARAIHPVEGPTRSR